MLEWYLKQNENVALRFHEDFYSTLNRIKENPTHYLFIAPGYRRCAFEHFKCMIIYEIQPERILVTSVKDMRSKPNKNFY